VVVSKHEWKPGDVVTATVDGRENVRLVAGWSRYEPRLRWCEMSPRWGDGDDDECWFMPSQVTDHRPLAVIDPEDEDTLRRIGDLLVAEDRGYDDESWQDLQAALREFAAPTPPKPDEPQGLGAVVEDAEGARYSRVDGDDEFPWAKSPVDAWQIECFAWHEFAAVRILSPGVQP
jgi:hypothetical protein